MTPARLRDLMKVVEARKTRDLAQLEALQARARGLEAEIEEARSLHARDAAEAGLAQVPFAFVGLRLKLADHLVAQAERRRAELQPEIEAARAQAAESLGKHSALEKLLENTEREQAALRLTRAERDAPPAEARSEDGDWG